MSMQETLTADTANIITVNASQFFGKSFNDIYKIYNVPKEETYEISSLFFKKLYKIRKENELLNSDVIHIKYTLFKRIIHKHCQMMSKYLNIKVQQQKVLSIFLKNLNRLSLKKDDIITINKLTFFYSKSTAKMLSQCSPLIAKSNNINKCAIKVFRILVYGSNKEHLPIELALILLFDAQTIYYIYDKLFEGGNNTYKIYMLELAILMCLGETPFGTIYFNEDSYYIRDNIPNADDIDFINSVNNKGNTFSLPYLIDYFGHKVWYEYFFPYNNKEVNNLFKFKLENFH